MRSRVVASVLALGLSVSAGMARAEGITAQPADTSTLAALCQASDRSYCYGYVTAAAQFYEAMIVHETVDPFVCPGREVSQQEAVTTFLDWHTANVQTYGGEPAIDGLFRSWMAAFPCE